MQVHLVASCSDKKLEKVPSNLRLRRVPRGDISWRAAVWCQRLADSNAPQVQALNLYGGQHWSVVRSLPGTGAKAGLDVSLWVASAGYGLWNCNWFAHGYSATFSGNSKDAVTRSGRSGRDVRQAWWDALSHGKHRLTEQPRTVAELAEQRRDAVIMVVAPPAYVEAMELDLIRVVQHQRSKSRLLVVSAPSRLQDGPLGPHWIACPGTLVSQVGGGVASLYARLARRLLKESGRTELDPTVVRERVDGLVRKAGDWPENTRRRAGDSEILRFIWSQLRKTPGQSRSALLRKFRDSQRKCQMERFNRLFAQVSEEIGRG
jgi:hypothetical protein